MTIVDCHLVRVPAVIPLSTTGEKLNMKCRRLAIFGHIIRNEKSRGLQQIIPSKITVGEKCKKEEDLRAENS